MKNLRTRLLAVVAIVVVAIGLSGSLMPSPASAMNQPQTTLTGTVNKLYWDLDAFWKWTLNNSNYQSPTIGYYYGSPSYVAACGGNLYDATIMAYCNGNQIWIHYYVNQSKVTRQGDYSAGFFLAHEWGHHIAKVLGIQYSFRSIKGRELYADCMAGVFTRYGWNTGRLDNSDYWEGIASLNDRFPNEGGGVSGYPLKADRRAWYEWGFSSYNLTNCRQALNVT